MGAYVIGLDYGTDSVRAVLLDTLNGEQLATSVYYYQRWKSLAYCNPIENQFRQHPLDHIEGLEITIREVMQQARIPASELMHCKFILL